MAAQQFGKPTKVMFWIVAGTTGLLAIAGFRREDGRSHERLNVAYASIASLKQSLFRPGQIDFEQVRITDTGTACIKYRERDPYGAVSNAQAVVHGQRISTSNSRDGRFEKEWDRQCHGLAFDATHAVNMFF